jgi:hypothetical protein
VGATSNLTTRLRTHSRGARWWDEAAYFVVTDPMDRGRASAVERDRISDARPPHNVQHNPDHRNEVRRPATSYAADLITGRLGEPLPGYVIGCRQQGQSWHRIALDLYERTGVLVTDETVRRWFGATAA